ncbi:hypothetical protein TRVA0_004S01794 [Trichomonascus vanleenenianus]|uniref:PaaI family thioesterase n=1 Tax=Trichomonascus vanleenenianus TaxID=2268995 RepID=UPI003ECB9BCB
MKTVAFVRSVWANFLEIGGLEPTLLKNLAITKAKPGKVWLEMTVEKEHVNRLGILHGGTIASIVDLGGSLAVASKGLYSTGVSTDLNVTYIASGGHVGNKITVDCTCEKLGGRLAFTSMNFYDAKSNSLFARGSHTKYIERAHKDPKNVKIEELE